MRVVVFGATGNVGTATMRALAADPVVTSIVGVARRLPGSDLDPRPTGSERGHAAGIEWRAVDLERDRLDVVAGADVVIHVAWKLQPQHHVPEMDATNIAGTQRLLEAMSEHAVPALVCASSVGAYAPGPKFRTPDGSWHLLDESWPATGVATSTYSTQKAAVERLLDEFERRSPATRLVRLRTSLVFQRAAGSEIHRLFLGPLAPWHLPRVLRRIPAPERLVFQATHADDIGQAYRLAATLPVHGAFNIAADPVITPAVIAEIVDGRTIRVPASLLRWAAQATFRLRLQPTEGGWIDMAVGVPLMATDRARRELGWMPTTTSVVAIRELVDGISSGAGTGTPPLAPRAAAGARWRGERAQRLPRRVPDPHGPG